MKVKDMSTITGRTVITIGPDATVRQAIEKLVQNEIGALPICDSEGALLGIISERDILRMCVKYAVSIDDARVDTVMTRDLVIALPEDDLNYISQVMINRGIRHMPVMSGVKLTGMISMRDIVNAQLADLEVQVRFLNAYISGGFV